MAVSFKKARARRWLGQSTVAFDPALGFHLGGTDYGGTLGKTSSYDPQGNRVLWSGALRNREDRIDLYHEASHGLDYSFMTDADRERARHLIDPQGHHAHVPWRWADMPPNERDPAKTVHQPFEEIFADTVAQLAMNRRGYHALRQFLAEIAARPKGTA